LSLLELYVDNTAPSFGGVRRLSPSDADIIIVGIPFDYTASFRSGSRFAPNAIRELASHLEFFSLRTMIDVERVRIADIGNLVVYTSVDKLVYVVRNSVAELLDYNKPIIVLGGEHTITLPIVQAVVAKMGKPCVLVFDAHFDLRDEFMGLRTCHATVMRRVAEIVSYANIMFLGVRAVSQEEIDYVNMKRIDYIQSSEFRFLGMVEVLNRVERWLKSASCQSLYISIDMDVYDPAYAPGVANPEPEGVEPWMLLDLLVRIITNSAKKPIIVDIVEYTPPYDISGCTGLLAAKTVLEAIAALYKRYRSK